MEVFFIISVCHGGQVIVRKAAEEARECLRAVQQDGGGIRRNARVTQAKALLIGDGLRLISQGNRLSGSAPGRGELLGRGWR